MFISIRLLYLYGTNDLYGFILYRFWNVNTLLLSFWYFIFPHPYTIILLLRSCHLNRALFIQSKDLLPPLHVELCLDIGRTTCCQVLPLVNFWIKYWQWFSITIACSRLLLTRKILLLVSDSWCHMHVTLYLTTLSLFQNVTVDGYNFD